MADSRGAEEILHKVNGLAKKGTGKNIQGRPNFKGGVVTLDEPV